MKKFQLFNWIVIVFLAFQFAACDNEPLEGEFPVDTDVVTAEEGQFVAKVGDINIIAIEAGGILTSENVLIITGTITDAGESIVLTIENADLGTFNITVVGGSLNSGIYFDGGTIINPYISTAEIGGFGELTLTEFDTELLTISGTFSFTGVRISLDSDGNPILDGEGNPILEIIEISAGSFNSIEYIEAEPDPTDEFFAKVNGVSFIPETITTTQVTIGGIPMINVVAVKLSGETIRIDFPEYLGLGTFAMEQVSDGTKLIGLYNANSGGENLTSNPGTLTITEYDSEIGKIVATFEFTGTDPLGQDPTVVEITEGSFTLYNLDLTLVTTNSFTASVDGDTFNPDEIVVIEDIINGFNVISIIATDSITNQNIGLIFPADIIEGTYNLSPILVNGDEKVGFYTPDIGNSIVYTSNPGTLTIISFDIITGVIEGTFQFIASDPNNVDPTTYIISIGEFTVIVQ